MIDFTTMNPKNMGRSTRLARHIAAKRANAGEPAVGPSRLAPREPQQAKGSPAPRVITSKPTAAQAKAVTAPMPPMTDTERQRRLGAEEVRRKAIAQRTAENRQAKINAEWAEVHTRAADPLAPDEPEDPKANHGWAKIHAEIRARRGN